MRTIILTTLFVTASLLARAQEQEFYLALNEFRTERGLSELTVSHRLEKQSLRWLKKTIKFPRLVHDKSFKGYDAEVLAQSQQPLADWLTSPGHRRVILNERATSIGVAYYNNRVCARLIYRNRPQF